jgi:hypothetical protein
MTIFYKSFFLSWAEIINFKNGILSNLIIEKKSSRCKFESNFMKIKFLWLRTKSISFKNRMYMSQMLIGLEKKNDLDQVSFF